MLYTIVNIASYAQLQFLESHTKPTGLLDIAGAPVLSGPGVCGFVFLFFLLSSRLMFKSFVHKYVLLGSSIRGSDPYHESALCHPGSKWGPFAN